MTKRIFTLTFALMMALLMSTDMNVAQANIYNDYAVYSDTKDNIKINEQNKPNTGNVQYTIPEAPGPIEVNTTEESINNREIDPSKPMIAITYDDGPSIYTTEILNTLKENNSVATFFVLGSQVHGNKDILNRMIEEGNQIGNHTYNHKNLTTISYEELYKQIQGTDDLVYIATGYTPTVMRPPYGSTSEELNKKIQKPIIQWSIDTRDWENRNAGIIVENILKDVKDGDIILMHDLYDSTVQASEIVIPELIKRGFQLVTIDELSEYREIVFTAGVNYYHMYK
ncbi:polysaccharide deacetylase family protein [Sedimentibacter hydroxybenzoicus DSM 7310]|uniref:Polysaccharide deacetylase family protein n=1 Tax=Sedimentibacter hydroxybenzoicus DSM 7310 TaxID=1123245 RepID=A0A974BI42_SEDHY|nr:polysaccharide deacetylase family protein [Sedimentibacter hydroxybenzoicus]NYB73593.1 polysaccharide deacetylase family protein [Sedimentibacter hydroxybenzoicus DSM 7310]